MYGFCDKCVTTYPANIGRCSKCDKALRILPIRTEYDYLLDGAPRDGITNILQFRKSQNEMF